MFSFGVQFQVWVFAFLYALRMFTLFIITDDDENEEKHQDLMTVTAQFTAEVMNESINVSVNTIETTSFNIITNSGQTISTNHLSNQSHDQADGDVKNSKDVGKTT